MSRCLYATAGLLAVLSILAGCGSKPLEPTLEKVQSVELEFALVMVVPLLQGEGEMTLPSEAPEDYKSGYPLPLDTAPEEPGEVEEPSEIFPDFPEDSEPEMESELLPGPDELEPILPPEEPEPPVTEPTEKEIPIYTVRQTLTLGDKIEVDRKEKITYQEEVKGFIVDKEGTRRFTIEGTSKPLADTGKFLLSLELTFIDESIEMSFICSPSILLSATENSEQILASSGNLRVRLICRKGSEVEYEK